MAINVNVQYNGGVLPDIILLVRDGDQKVRKYLFPEIFYGRQTVSYEEIFPGNFGVGGVKDFLGKKKRF